MTAIALAMLLSAVAAAPAGAASEIERVWSFNGGEVAIALQEGKLEGIVVKATTFNECQHKVGEHMWTGMTLQPDGSYWGSHQWLFQGSCAPNPVLGPTAWRVLQTSSGSRSLKVCFSEPGASQPTIAPSGTSASVTRECVTSAPTAPLPVVSNGQGEGAQIISFSRGAVCSKLASLKIKLHNPRRDPLKEVLVWVKGKKVADVRGVARLKRAIVLKHLPTGTYTVKVQAITVLNQKLTGKRTYHGCGKGSSGIPLHHPKTHKRG